MEAGDIFPPRYAWYSRLTTCSKIKGVLVLQVNFEQALKVFKQFNKESTPPSLHPYYIAADACRDPGLNPVFFVFQQNREYFYHGFHLSPLGTTGLADIQSSYGYGGPIATSSDRAFLAQAWSAYDEWCLGNHVLAEFIRFHPLLNNWRFYQGDVIEDRETVWIDLDREDLLSTYSARARTAVRKAIKNGVRVDWWESARFMEFFPVLYRSAMAELKASQFYYFNPEYFNQLIYWPHSRLAAATADGDLKAAAIFLVYGDIMEYHLSASTRQGKNLCAANLILHQAGLLARQLGCRRLYLGGGTDSQPGNSLLFFKAGFSPRRASFKIGKRIRLPDQYERMKNDWLKSKGPLPQRILFYR